MPTSENDFEKARRHPFYTQVVVVLFKNLELKLKGLHPLVSVIRSLNWVEFDLAKYVAMSTSAWNALCALVPL